MYQRISLFVYRYVCVYVCVYMYMCVYVCMYLCTYECMYACIHACMNVCVYIYIYTYIINVCRNRNVSCRSFTIHETPSCTWCSRNSAPGRAYFQTSLQAAPAAPAAQCSTVQVPPCATNVQHVKKDNPQPQPA